MDLFIACAIVFGACLLIRGIAQLGRESAAADRRSRRRKTQDSRSGLRAGMAAFAAPVILGVALIVIFHQSAEARDARMDAERAAALADEIRSVGIDPVGFYDWPTRTLDGHVICPSRAQQEAAIRRFKLIQVDAYQADGFHGHMEAGRAVDAAEALYGRCFADAPIGWISIAELRQLTLKKEDS